MSTSSQLSMYCALSPPPPIALKIEDLICYNNPPGFRWRQFVKPQHLLQHSENTETNQVHSIICPQVVDVLSSLSPCLQRPRLVSAASFFSAAQKPPDSTSDRLQTASICLSHLCLASSKSCLLLLILSDRVHT